MALLMLICGITGYLLGSVNFSLIIGKFYGTDVRQHGSGNAGTTNTLRVLGKKAAAMVFAGDILKGVIACLLGRLIAGGDIGIMAAGFGAIIGHNWPLYFGFKGGKGVLTSAAVVMMMDWRAGAICLTVFIILVAITRYVSLGSIVGAGLFPIVSLVMGRNALFIIFSTAIAILIIFRHRSNIVRLLNGTESKLFKKK
jgi:glycerol-3-phosphate acyltransferase PlsY